MDVDLASMNLRIGSHCGPGGKLCLASLEQALDQGATALQMFAGNPQRYWPSSSTSDEIFAEYKTKGAGVYSMIHSVYILNACEKPDQRNARMTRHSLVKQLVWAERAGCKSLVFHPGSAKENDRGDAVGWLIEAVTEVMTDYEGPVRLLLENKAVKDEKLTGITGSQRGITGNLLELAWIVEQIGCDRVGICVDTTHCFSSGYDVPAMISAIKDPHVWPKTDVIHFNTPDPGVKKGSGTDRHSSHFEDGVFSMKHLADLFQALKEKVLILEGTPDFPADLVWLLRWELESRDGEGPTLPPQVEGAVDPSEHHDASAIP
jgi:deoxyribonuclease-4